MAMEGPSLCYCQWKGQICVIANGRGKSEQLQMERVFLCNYMEGAFLCNCQWKGQICAISNGRGKSAKANGIGKSVQLPEEEAS